MHVPILDSVPLHFFVSFSSKDEHSTLRVLDAASDHRIPTWLAPEQLIPGAPDWEEAIRHAIQQSFGIFLIATPHSRQSPYVSGEVQLALTLNKPIIPIWIANAPREECITLGLTKIQYLDARTSSRAELGTALSRVVSRVVSDRLPNHFLVDSVRLPRKTPWGEFAELRPAPPGYVCIELPSSSEWGRGACVRLASHPSMRSLLDSVYLAHLSGTVPPMTYGDEWILMQSSESSLYQRLAVPWQWARAKSLKTSSIASDWAHAPPSAHGISANTPHWKVFTDFQRAPIAILAAHDRIVQQIFERPKGLLYLSEVPGIFAEDDTNEPETYDHEHIGVYTPIEEFMPPRHAGGSPIAYVQTRPLTDEERKFLGGEDDWSPSISDYRRSST